MNRERPGLHMQLSIVIAMMTKGVVGQCLKQACSNSLRLYAVDNLRTADRTTLRKAAVVGQFAGAFCSSRGPGIACITPEGILKVSQRHCIPTVLVDNCYEELCCVVHICLKKIGY